MAISQPSSVAAALIGITLSAAFVGANLAISYLAVPSLLLSAQSTSGTNPSSKAATAPPHLAKQWFSIYNHAKPIAVTGSAIGSANFIYAALQLSDSHSTRRNLLFAAASMAVFVVPYTLIFMNPTNFALIDQANTGDTTTDVDPGDVMGLGMPKAQGVSGYGTEELLNWWAKLNYGRAAIPFVGIGCAIVALVW